MRSDLVRDLDRRIVPTWARSKPRRRHRELGPAKLPVVLALIVSLLVIRLEV